MQMILQGKTFGPTYIVLEGYYIFFALFMLGAAIRNKTIMDNCGFLKHILPKSIFYIFLASLAFGDVAFWSCDVFGAIFVAIAVMNFLRYCGGGEEPEYDEVTGEVK